MIKVKDHNVQLLKIVRKLYCALEMIQPTKYYNIKIKL